MSVIDDKWEEIFEKYDIKRKIRNNGLFYITADQIRAYREPRLMTKFDTKESLPSIFENKLAILPVTRGSYVIGEFDLYKDISMSTSRHIIHARVPDYYETINIERISSEANAINVMSIASILDDFLEEKNMMQTISGRMSSGVFGFEIRGKTGKYYINVENSQIEIDGGFENPNCFSVIEAKNVIHDNFLVRQLYYPFRTWRNKIHKPIRPIFMIYSNNIFRLIEYGFENEESYNSIRLINDKSYSLEDIEISMEDLIQVLRSTNIEKEPDVSFVQADSFEKIISLIEQLNESEMTKTKIADLFGFKERQSDYYFNACRYLGLTEKRKTDDGQIKVFITDKARNILNMQYKKRQLEYVRLILQHRIFNEIFAMSIQNGEIPDNNYIASRMKDLNLCGENLILRRASSVRGWIKWIFSLIS